MLHIFLRFWSRFARDLKLDIYSQKPFSKRPWKKAKKSNFNRFFAWTRLPPDEKAKYPHQASCVKLLYHILWFCQYLITRYCVFWDFNLLRDLTKISSNCHISGWNRHQKIPSLEKMGQSAFLLRQFRQKKHNFFYIILSFKAGWNIAAFTSEN